LDKQLQTTELLHHKILKHDSNILSNKINHSDCSK